MIWWPLFLFCMVSCSIRHKDVWLRHECRPFQHCSSSHRFFLSADPTENPGRSWRLRSVACQKCRSDVFRSEGYTLLGTNISHQNSLLKMIFLFPRWDMLVSWRVYYCYRHGLAIVAWFFLGVFCTNHGLFSRKEAARRGGNCQAGRQRKDKSSSLIASVEMVPHGAEPTTPFHLKRSQKIWVSDRFWMVFGCFWLVFGSSHPTIPSSACGIAVRGCQSTWATHWQNHLDACFGTFVF